MFTVVRVDRFSLLTTVVFGSILFVFPVELKFVSTKFSRNNSEKSHHKLSPLPRYIFDSLGQNADQMHTKPQSICQKVTVIHSPNTACTIGIDHRQAILHYLYNCLLWGWTFVADLCHWLGICMPNTCRSSTAGTIRIQPAMVAYRHWCIL